MHIHIDISSDEFLIFETIVRLCNKHSLYCEIGQAIPCDLFITDTEQVRNILGSVVICLIPKYNRDDPTVYHRIERLIEVAIVKASNGPIRTPNEIVPFYPLLIGAIIIGLVASINFSVLK